MPNTIEITFTDEEWKRVVKMAVKDGGIDLTIKKAIDYYWHMKFGGYHDVDEFYKE